ncbi:MAG: hypothetical protein ACFFCV_19340 [Promethearchaeota archaeon]
MGLILNIDSTYIRQILNMFRIEKIGDQHFYVKVLGTFPPSVAEKFIIEFNKSTKELKNFSFIVDGVDLILLNLKSFHIILDFLKKNNERLVRSAYIIAGNPVLDKEAQILLDKAESPKRKIVSNLNEAKEWLGLSEIIIEKD